MPKTIQQPRKDNVVELKKVEVAKNYAQIQHGSEKSIKESSAAPELVPEDIAKAETAINQSPLPINEPEPVNQQSTKDIKKLLVPVITDTDEYGLVTEAPTDHLSLDELPVVRRLAAGIIDIAILLIINIMLISISLLIVKTSPTALLPLRYYFIALFLLIHYLYYTYFTLIYQATPGKLMMNIRVVSLANLKSTKLTFQQVCWRWLTMIGGIIVLLGGMLYMLFDDNHAALQDRLSLSLVVSKKQFDALKNE